MGKKPLRDIDTQRNVDLLRAIGFCLMPMAVLVQVLFGSPIWFAILAGLGLSIILGWIIRAVTERTGAAAASMLVPTNTHAPYSYSEQESLVMRGRFDAAADSYRTWIAMHLEDHTARLRLATLLTEHLREWDEAERVLLEARGLVPSDDMGYGISNGLIDLYRTSGQRDKLKTELARFAYLYRRTTAGADARAHLQALTREESEAPS